MAILLHSAYTIQPCTVSCHFLQSHVPRVHACLAGTCHLHFWQNDRDLLQAVDQLAGSPSFDQGGGNPTLISYGREGGREPYPTFEQGEESYFDQLCEDGREPYF